jgi:predicted metal-dependent HD superfamily phosphohydrolase
MSKHDDPIVRLAAQQVFQIFRNARPDNPLVFHNFGRTRALVDASREIAKGAKLDDADLPVLLVAAWFHDTGYALGPKGNRKQSAEAARAFLAEQRQPQHLADEVAAAIEATDSPSPDKLVQEVLHDALLIPIANKEYLAIAEQFRLELERRKGEVHSDVEWTQICIAFFDNHHFRTRYAQIECNAGRAANLVRLHKVLRKQVGEAAEHDAEEAKVTKGVGKTVENLFDSISRNQVQLFKILDRRTSTMIQVNAIMITLVVGLLLRRVEDHRELLMPTLLLLTANLVTIFISIYSMRVGRAGLRRILGSDAPAHDENLLMFSNDTQWSLDEYKRRMERLATNWPALQQTLVEAMYFIRKLLIQRVKALRISYDVFIAGLVISVVAFAFAMIRR